MTKIKEKIQRAASKADNWGQRILGKIFPLPFGYLIVTILATIGLYVTLVGWVKIFAALFGG